MTNMDGSGEAFTPGPWVVGSEWPFGGEWIGPSDADIVQLNDEWPLERLDELRANAHLIAAAPDLYKSLQAAVGLWAFRSTDNAQQEWLGMARAALAKARGEA